MLTHPSEALKQVEVTKVAKDRWVGGDVSFSSVSFSVELRKRLILHLTFIIKSNNKFSPQNFTQNIGCKQWK